MNQLLRFQSVLGSRYSDAGASHARRLLVLVQVALERERLAAPGARVRLVCRVRLDVRSKVGLVGERLGALRTAERAFAGVCANVSLEQPRPREPLAAVWTGAALRVCPHVHAVRRDRRVHLQHRTATLVAKIKTKTGRVGGRAGDTARRPSAVTSR